MITGMYYRSIVDKMSREWALRRRRMLNITCGRNLCSAPILYTAEKATQMALQAIQILGGNGYTNDYAAGRLLRDAKLYEIGAGTSEIRRMLIGRELFKETL